MLILSFSHFFSFHSRQGPFIGAETSHLPALGLRGEAGLKARFLEFRANEPIKIKEGLTTPVVFHMQNIKLSARRGFASDEMNSHYSSSVTFSCEHEAKMQAGLNKDKVESLLLSLTCAPFTLQVKPA